MEQETEAIRTAQEPEAIESAQVETTALSEEELLETAELTEQDQEVGDSEPVEAFEEIVVLEDLETRYAPRVISAQNAFIMRSIMREVVQRGTAVRAKALGRKDIAGKTGTTQNNAFSESYRGRISERVIRHAVRRITAQNA